MTLGYPGAFDSIELLRDGLHAPTGEDWTELADGMGGVSSLLGALGGNWAGWPSVAEILAGLRRSASGVVNNTSANLGAGLSVSLPANVFSVAGDIGVQAFRIGLGATPPATTETGPVTFEASSITTSSFTLKGYQPSGAASSGAQSVRVGWLATQKRANASGPLTLLPFNPDVLPPVISGFDEIRADLPNAVMTVLDTALRHLGRNPVGAIGGAGSWSTVAAFLGAFDSMFTGEFEADANLLLNLANGGVEVVVDGSLFPDPNALQIHATSFTDGADSGSSPGQHFPIAFMVYDVTGGAGSPLHFKVVGWKRNGGAYTGFTMPTDPILVKFVIRTTMGAPV